MWTRRTTYLLIASGLLVVVVLAYPWLQAKWYENYRYIEKAKDIGFSLDARRNPYLAAEKYLSKLNKSVYYPNININWAKVDSRPSPDSCVFWNGSRLGMGESQLSGLLQWLDQGGHLITVVTTLFDESTGTSGDIFLDDLGVRQYLTDYNEKQAADIFNTLSRAQDEANSGTENTDLSDAVNILWPAQSIIITKIGIQLADQAVEIEVNFDPRYRMEDAYGQATVSYASDYGIHALSYQKNKGQVFVVTDPWLWENKDINRLDHAYFLWYLTKNCSDIWLIYNNEVLNLWDYIWLYGAWCVVSLVILLIAWLWYVSFRLGPVTVTSSPDRRQLMEHLKAASYFLWRRRMIDKPIALLRKDISKSLAKHHYSLSPEHEESSPFQYLSRLTRIPVKDITWAMQADPDYRLIDFVKMISILSAIRKTL